MENENKRLTPEAEQALRVLTNELWRKDGEFKEKKHYVCTPLERVAAMCYIDLGIIQGFLSLDPESDDVEISSQFGITFDPYKPLATLPPLKENMEDVEAMVKLGIAYAYSAIGDKKAAMKECPILLPFFKPKSAKLDLTCAKGLLSAAIEKLDKEKGDNEHT